MTKNELLKILSPVDGETEIVIREPDIIECAAGIGHVEISGHFFVRNEYIESQRGDLYCRDWDHDDADMTASEWKQANEQHKDVVVLNLER